MYITAYWKLDDNGDSLNMAQLGECHKQYYMQLPVSVEFFFLNGGKLEGFQLEMAVLIHVVRLPYQADAVANCNNNNT